MEDRERTLGIGPGTTPHTLVHPILFSDGEYFPVSAKSRQHEDLRRFNAPHPYFRETERFLELDQKVQGLVTEIATTVLQAPAWDNGWPVAVQPPAPVEVQHFPIPRLGG